MFPLLSQILSHLILALMFTPTHMFTLFLYAPLDLFGVLNLHTCLSSIFLLPLPIPPASPT